MHSQILDAMRAQLAFAKLADSLPPAGTALRIGGLPGSSPALLIAAMARTRTHRIWIIVAHSPPEAEAVTADLHALLSEDAAVLFPQLETLPYEAEQEHVELGGLRVEALEALLAGRCRILVTTARALQEKAAIPTGLADLRMTLAKDQTIRLAQLAGQLEEMGFKRVPLVEAVGQFAVRGGILDLFGFGSPEPVRIEFWGDEIASIRTFDILDQRSTGERSSVDILPVDLAPEHHGEGPGARRSLLDVVARDAVLVELADGESAAEFTRTWTQVRHLHELERKRGGRPEPPEILFLPPDQAVERFASFGRLIVSIEPPHDLRFDARPAEPIERDMDRLATLLRAGAARAERTWILCDNEGQIERLESILAERGMLPPGTTIALGAIHSGFVLEGMPHPVRVLTDHEIFSRARRLRRTRRFRGAVALESLSQLRPGDFIVHLDHGIGRFLRLEHVRVADQEIESLAIEYANGEILRVPVYRLDLIERWVPDRDDAATPRLHRIGGKTWKTLRRKTEKAIQEMAAELLQLYAARQMATRPPFPPDGRWQKEMESSFLYEDTPDQRHATADVKRDMESRHPMDRLLCGDVGYGKTEIAIRAAFKSALEGRQVAVLAPTTILVEQHLHTFRQRLAGYPVRIEAISRFRSAKEQTHILGALAGGQIDILIGTHRIIEPDVVFRNLGLMIVDEEQRFGVKQKERLKALKHNLDVLSLTATPIPRTLHLSLAGLRDLSLLQTPPRDRMPIITHVLPWVDQVLEDAIHRELDRGGQIFVVHNRVQSIEGAAARVRSLAPDTIMDIAHGQMPSSQLEVVMRRFLDGEIRILVSSAIIENGLDVPTANTLIVDRADYFGLAQLYQLRGRVGRSHHRAYCYLVVPENVQEDAERRLRILEHFTDLGSGYAIALKDLELRGSGNILGADQSGFVHAIGLDTYTRLLEQTIRRLKEGVTEEVVPCDVSIDGAAFLPDFYIADDAQKLHLYRRLSRLESPDQLDVLALELTDRYGSPPQEAKLLIDTTRLRLLGTAAAVERIAIRGQSARVSFRDAAIPRMAHLQDTFRDRQVEIDVKRAHPLSFVLRSRGAFPITETVALALTQLLPHRAAA
ncbi:MAG: transcription-repair coupling factor [Longimicrobiales bacterium]